MALSAFANLAAAITAGYVETATQQTDGFYFVTLEKWLTGGTNAGSGFNMRAFGRGTTQAAAETQALAALNNQRGHRYGFDSGSLSLATPAQVPPLPPVTVAGVAHTIDVT